MNIDRLVGEMLRAAVGTRQRRRTRTRRTRSRVRSVGGLKALLGAVGVAWGVYEAWQRRQSGQALPTGVGARSVPSAPPVPSAAAGVPLAALRLVRLAISAARADGELAAEESARVLVRARRAGAEDVVRAEIEQPLPLEDIVRGVTGADERRELYVLAYAIVHSDAKLTGAERIYLARLAHLLGLSPADAARIEAETHANLDRIAGTETRPEPGRRYSAEEEA